MAWMVKVLAVQAPHTDLHSSAHIKGDVETQLHRVAL